MKRLALLFLACGGLHVPAYAQDTYVGASLTADVVRFSGPDDARPPELSGGEAIGFALRLGTRVGTAWGVEAEFSRPAEIRHEGDLGVVPLPGVGEFTFTAPDGTVTVVPDSLILPPRSYRVRTAYRDVTLSAGIWARQDLSTRFALVYTGGIGFHRTEREAEFRFDPIRFSDSLFTSGVIGGIPIIPRAPINFGPAVYEAVSTQYTARPFAGVEARISMTERIDLVPGIRLHGLAGGLLVRPSVGLNWEF